MSFSFKSNSSMKEIIYNILNLWGEITCKIISFFVSENSLIDKEFDALIEKGGRKLFFKKYQELKKRGVTGPQKIELKNGVKIVIYLDYRI
ncbi:hypothetical protein ACQ1Q5_06505 [Ornithobacterium rhinotracheale]